MTTFLPADESSETSTPEFAHTTEMLAVGAVVVIIGMRLTLSHLVTVGDLLAFFLIPVWLPYLRRYAGAQAFIALGVLAGLSGLVLTYWNAATHRTGLAVILNNNALLVSLLVSVGFLLWARSRFGAGAVLALFAVGMILGVDHSSSLYQSGPWKFGYAPGVTLLVLSLGHYLRSRVVELVALAALILVSALTDSRSIFAMLLLVAALRVWQSRPSQRTSRAAAGRAVLGLAVVGVAIYNVGKVLILNGALGQATRQRSVYQIDKTGSLLLGGRPEIGATVNLMRDQILGYGSGTRANLHDLTVAKAGMAKLNYDPNNGYVENFMFGGGFELHSLFGDGWARFGLPGLALVLFILIQIIAWLARSLASKTATAPLLFLAINCLWNTAFSPWYSALDLTILTVALLLGNRDPGGAPSATSQKLTEVVGVKSSTPGLGKNIKSIDQRHLLPQPHHDARP